jgi:hypothetical protein
MSRSPAWWSSRFLRCTRTKSRCAWIGLGQVSGKEPSGGRISHCLCKKWLRGPGCNPQIKTGPDTGLAQGAQCSPIFAYNPRAMKKKWIIATLLIAAAAFAQQTHNQIRAAERSRCRSKTAHAICRGLGRGQDVLSAEREADRDERYVQAVHDPGRQVSPVGFHLLQS